MRRRIKKAGAAILASAVLASAVFLSDVHAAQRIDTDRKCSVSFEVDGVYPELAKLEIPVKLYKVAEVRENGIYDAREGYGTLGLEKLDSSITAEMWKEKAEEAAAITKEQGREADAETTLRKTGNIGGLSAGMYLVTAQETQSAYDTYRFAPYLLALPDNRYYDGKGDAWIYHVETGLKPEQEERKGRLVIEKTLISYNETFGGAVFVFSVEAVKDGKRVYSDVISLAFDGTGTKQAAVEGLPAGAEVTVTEIYSGSGYQATGGKSRTVIIEADEEGKEPVKAAFENEYDHRLNGGSGVVNHFEYTKPETDGGESGSGTWEWEQMPDNADTLE